MTDEQTGFEFTDADLEILGASDHRPDAYWDDDLEKWVLRLSRINICTKSLVCASLDMPQADVPSNIRVRMDESTLLEDELLARVANGDFEWWMDGKVMPKSTPTIKYTRRSVIDVHAMRGLGRGIKRVQGQMQFKARIPIGRDGVAAGSLDDIGDVFMVNASGPIDENGLIVITEGKCLSKDLFDAFLRKGRAFNETYALQHDGYIVAARLGLDDPARIIGLFAVGEKLYPKYRTRKDGKPGAGLGRPTLGRVVVQIITETETTLAGIKARGAGVLGAITAADGNGLAEDMKCDKATFPCPFHPICDKVEKQTAVGEELIPVENVEGEDGELLRFSLEKYREHHEKEAEHKRLKAQYKADIDRLVVQYGGGQNGPGMVIAIGDKRFSIVPVYEEWGDHTPEPKFKAAGSKLVVTMREVK